MREYMKWVKEHTPPPTAPARAPVSAAIADDRDNNKGSGDDENVTTPTTCKST
jgi:hypothetical protein